MSMSLWIIYKLCWQSHPMYFSSITLAKLESHSYRNTKVYAVRFHLYKLKLTYSDRNRSGFLAGRLRRVVEDYEDPIEEDEEICILLMYVCKNPSNCTF